MLFACPQRWIVKMLIGKWRRQRQRYEFDSVGDSARRDGVTGQSRGAHGAVSPRGP